MATTNKERQKQFRESKLERDASGNPTKKQVTLYVDRDISMADIQARLANESPVPLQKAALDDLAAREHALDDRLEDIARREDLVKRRERVSSGVNNLEDSERWLKGRKEDLAQREAAFEREQLALTKKEARAGKISFANRRSKLVEIHTTKKSWDSSNRQNIDTSWSANEAAKTMSDLSRKTNIAGNTIQELLTQFGKNELLTEREHAALELAGKVLTELASAAGDAKDMVRATAKAITEAEEARNKAAKAAAKKEFGDRVSIADMIVILEWSRSRYLLEQLSNFKRSGSMRDLEYPREQAENTLIEKIADLMKNAGANCANATKQVRAEFDAVRPCAVEKHADLIRDLNAKLVQHQMELAEKKESKHGR